MNGENLADVDKVWEKYSKSKDPELKNQLLVHYVDLVERIVRRIMPKYREFNDKDDLVSCGVIGLIDALDKYDINYGVKFETYASTRIRGEILDYMRKQDWAPASLRAKINRINSATETFEGLYGRSPTDDEIAQSMDMSVIEVRGVLEKTHIFNVMHFEDLVSDTSAVKLKYYEDNDPETVAQEKETKMILADIIESLPEKEKLVVTLYYYEEMTLKEIASVLNVTESRVSQIHSKVLGRIGTKFNRAVGVSYVGSVAK